MTQCRSKYYVILISQCISKYDVLLMTQFKEKGSRGRFKNRGDQLMIARAMGKYKLFWGNGETRN